MLGGEVNREGQTIYKPCDLGLHMERARHDDDDDGYSIEFSIS
jgi:hypothetical protein